MKILYFLTAVIFPFLSLAQTSDRELVHKAIEDYVDALYLAKPELIQRSVHPQLTKKGFWRKTAEDPSARNKR